MIGIFDSGSGGLTVLRALRERAPACDVVYFADFLNMPYGEKLPDELRTLTRDVISFLREQGAQEIISACNSVSAQVITTLSKELSDEGIEIIEMVTPTVNALQNQKDRKILLVATQATVSSDIYKNAFLEKGIHIEQIALPPLASLIEEGASEEKIHYTLKTYLGNSILQKPDIVILGCTQYPLAKKSFETFFEENNIQPTIFDPAYAVADEALKKFNTKGEGRITFFTSKESPYFEKLKSTLFDK